MTATSQNVSIVQHPGKLQWVGGAAAGIWVGPVARKTPLLVEFVALMGGFAMEEQKDLIYRLSICWEIRLSTATVLDGKLYICNVQAGDKQEMVRVSQEVCVRHS